MLPQDATAPAWMLTTPKSRPETRKFNKREYPGWSGQVSLFTLEGWEENPRLDIPVENFREEHAGRSPNNDELLEIMLDVSVNDRSNDDEDEEDENNGKHSRRNKLLELAESIRLNAIRQPLIMTHDGRIIDGNRRYYASLYLYRMTDDLEIRRNYEMLPAWVLPSAATADDEDHVLTELNAINDCYDKWRYSVIARRIYNDHSNGATIDQLVNKYYNYTRSRISTVIEASKVASDFIQHHEDSIESKDLAYRKLIWFDELRRSNGRAMDREDFRTAIYDLVLDPNTPFSKAADFKNLAAVYNNPDAWEVLLGKKGKEGLRQANYIVERDRYEGSSDTQARLERMSNTLKAILKGTGFGLVDGEVLAQFHEVVDQVPGRRMTAESRALQVADLLNGLTSQEMARLSDITLQSLANALERVTVQTAAYRDR
jgi:hypothetical protein